TDLAGNATTRGSLLITIDTVAPAAPSTPDLLAASDSGVRSTDDITNDTTPTVTGTAEGGSTVQILEGTTFLGGTVATIGLYTATTSALTAGVHALRAQASDVAGNVGALSGALNVTIDTIGPTLASASMNF